MITREAPAEDPLTLVFSALADPTRRAILVRLTQGDASVSELAGPFEMSQPAVSKHLRVLEKARAHLAQPGGDLPIQPSGAAPPQGGDRVDGQAVLE